MKPTKREAETLVVLRGQGYRNLSGSTAVYRHYRNKRNRRLKPEPYIRRATKREMPDSLFFVVEQPRESNLSWLVSRKAELCKHKFRHQRFEIRSWVAYEICQS